jgi:predicted small secreted protein
VHRPRIFDRFLIHPLSNWKLKGAIMKRVLLLLLLAFVLAACGETGDQNGKQIGNEKSGLWDAGRWDQARYH